MLLAAVSRWAHLNGWRYRRGVGTYECPDEDPHLALALPHWLPAIEGPEFSSAAYWSDNGEISYRVDGRWTVYGVTSVEQAVDFLVDLGVLPKRFHRIHRELTSNPPMLLTMREVPEP